MYLIEYSLVSGKLNGKEVDGEPQVDVTGIRGYFDSKSKRRKILVEKLKEIESELDWTMVTEVNFKTKTYK